MLHGKIHTLRKTLENSKIHYTSHLAPKSPDDPAFDKTMSLIPFVSWDVITCIFHE